MFGERILSMQIGLGKRSGRDLGRVDVRPGFKPMQLKRVFSNAKNPNGVREASQGACPSYTGGDDFTLMLTIDLTQVVSDERSFCSLGVPIRRFFDGSSDLPAEI